MPSGWQGRAQPSVAGSAIGANGTLSCAEPLHRLTSCRAEVCRGARRDGGLDTPDAADDSPSPFKSIGVEMSEGVRSVRRSQRVIFDRPVNVYISRENQDPAFEVAKTLSVNVHGALLALTTPVAFGEILRLINPRTHQEIECHVCRFAMRYPNGVTQVGVEFAAAAPTFWDVPAPPPDWDPAWVPPAERVHVGRPTSALKVPQPGTQSAGAVEDAITVETLAVGPDDAAVSDGKPNSRRSVRLAVKIPVVLYAHEENNAPSCIEGRTLSVNMDGALLLVAESLYIGQSVLLINYKTKEEIVCHVRSVDWAGGSVNHVGVEFATASPKFWGVTFPPEDWNEAERKLAQRPLPMHATLKPSLKGAAADPLNETELIIEEAVRVQESFETGRSETKPKRPLPTKAASVKPDAKSHPLTDLQRSIGEAQQDQQESLKAGEARTEPKGWRVFKWPIIALAGCIALFIIWISVRRSSEGGSAAVQSPASAAGVAPADANIIPQLEGSRLATAEDFNPDSVSWLRGTGREASGEISGAFTAFGQSKAYVLVGKDAMWRIVILADGQLRCDAKYRSVALVARVPKQVIQNIIWSDPPPSGSEGDGLLVVRDANDLGSGVVLLLRGGEVVSGTPSSYQQIPMREVP